MNKTNKATEAVTKIISIVESRSYFWQQGLSEHSKHYVKLHQPQVRVDGEVKWVYYFNVNDKGILHEELKGIIYMYEDKFKLSQVNDTEYLEERDIELLTKLEDTSNYTLKIGYTNYLLDGKVPRRDIIYRLDSKVGEDYYFTSLDGLIKLIKEEELVQ